MANIIDKVAWMSIRNRSVLFARSHDNTLFYSVGGKREAGESDMETLARESLEETGARIIVETAQHLKTFEGSAHGAPEGTQLRLACYEAEAEGEPTAQGEVNELAWFTTADMHRTTEMGQEILLWLATEGLID